MVWHLTLLAAYIIWYLQQGCKPDIVVSKNKSDPMRKILLEEFELHENNFWPFVLLPTAWCQAFMSGLIKCAHSLRRPVFGVQTQKVCTDRGDFYLHWYPKPSECKIPIVLYFHTIVGNGLDSRSRTVYNIMKSKGYQLVTYSRRGHHRPSLHFSPIGEPCMTAKALQEVNKRTQREILVLGDSGGGSPVMRLMGDLALSGHNPYRVVGTVVISAGFTFDPLPPFGYWATDHLLLPKLRCYWINEINREKFPNEAANLEQTKNTITWTRDTVPFSGYSTWEEFYDATDAAVNYEALKSQKRFKKFIPNVLINSRDDMFFPGGLVDKYRDIFTSASNWALIITERGGHCAFLDFFGNDWALNLAARLFDRITELGEEHFDNLKVEQEVLLQAEMIVG